jgi:hypothetical protein
MDKRVSEAPQRHGSKKVIHGLYEPEIDGLIAAEHDEEVRALMALYVTSCKHRKYTGLTITQKLKNQLRVKNTGGRDAVVQQIKKDLASVEALPVKVKHSETERSKIIHRNRAFNIWATDFMLTNFTLESASELLSQCSSTGRSKKRIEDLDRRLSIEFLKTHPQFADLSANNKKKSYGRWPQRPTVKSLLTERVSNESSLGAGVGSDRWSTLVDVVTTEASRVGVPDAAAQLQSNENSETAGALLAGDLMEVDGARDDVSFEVRCLAAECLRMPLLC